MQIVSHEINQRRIAEVQSGEIVINTAEDGLDLLGSLYYEGFDKVVLYKEQFCPAFFDLKTGLAGEILQKFSNYRMQLTIVGNVKEYSGKSLQGFILECNKGKLVNFVNSLDDALVYK